MPSCANCQTPYKEGQQFCKTCGDALLSPVAQQVSCPGCGAPISDQIFCHECGMRLDAAPGSKIKAALSTLSPPQGRRGSRNKVIKGSPMQILALVGGCLVLLVAIVGGIYWLSGRTSSGPAATVTQGKGPSAAGKPSPGGAATPEVLGPPFFSKPTKMAELAKAPTAPAPGTPEPALSFKEEMEEVLLNMRQGHEQKNIDLFMTCFSPSFPELDKKRQDTLKLWARYDYSHLVFNIDDIQEVGPDSHIALVTWEVQARDLNTQKVKTSSQRYKVWFVKEQGRRLIKSLEKEGKEEVG